MKKNKQIRLILLISIIILILGIFLLYNAWPNLTGQRIILDTRAYDPFDPLRGQYMQIFYEINSLEGSGFIDGDTACVLLEEDSEGIHRPKDVSRNKFYDETFICGNVKYVSGDTLRVEYDIERFYFEKGASVPNRNITVEVAVSSGGRARITELLQNGEPVEIEYETPSWKS
jgi:uncharacterized membrane-anchored protein